MEPVVVMMMEKDLDTGFLSKEKGSYTIREDGNLIDSIYMVQDEGLEIVHVKLTTDRDVEDWEYAAILDYYDQDQLKDMILSFEEIEESYNPTWEITMPFTQGQLDMEDRLNHLLKDHKNQLIRVYGEIEHKKEEYL